MARTDRTVEDLLREMESPKPKALPEGGEARRAGPLLALLILAMGFGAGWMVASSRASLAGGGAPKGSGESRADLLADGWSESDQGVFTRRCRGNCRRPMVYGGGIADVMEVSCLERPCGEISVVFDVLDARGQAIDRLTLRRPGLQGERLQFLLESDKQGARRFALREFSARAKVY